MGVHEYVDLTLDSRGGEGLYGLLSQVSGVPTTLFVDSEGKQVGTAYIGAKDLDGWKAVADELLESLEA